MRVFLDTNVLVSAFATRGICADVLRLVLTEHTLVIGDVVLHELTRSLRTRIRLPARMVDEIEAFLRESEIVPRPPAPWTLPVRDEDDRWVLASAIAGKAEVFVTGDRDLLDVADQVPIRIVDPRGFWQMLRKT
ncbi:MAG: putative toxin-antitoxin system toxin component, PIN family [candidate division NC10 bacterium]|nr:putative toxin-antitoxin system toxin component, PIN family [candidate division NC10 bacterium]